MAYSLETLQASLKAAEYTPMSDEEIVRQSQTKYQNAYESSVLGAKQTHELGEMGYDRQLEQVASGYEREAAQAKAQTTQTLRETDRLSLSRGMQRSSYNLATLSNIQLAGDNALSGIAASRTRDENDISQQRTMSAKQLGETLSQLRREYDTNVLAYSDTLRDREYQRSAEAARYQNELAMAMYEYTSRQQQQQVEQQRWLTEFNESVRQFEVTLQQQQMAAQSSGSSGKSSSKPAVVTSQGKTVALSSVTGTMSNAGAKKVVAKVSDYR